MDENTQKQTFMKGLGVLIVMADTVSVGFFIFTWLFMLWMAWFYWNMIQSLLDLNDKIFAHVGLKAEDEIDVGQRTLTEFSDEQE